MTATIILTILHVLCIIFNALNVALADDKKTTILYSFCTICWVICLILDIAKLVSYGG